MICSIEGNIGVGKSTVLENLIELDPTFKILPEPVTDETLMQKYYEDPYTYAFPFQLQMLARRTHQFMQALEQINYADSDIVFMERTIFTDYHVFAKLVTKLGYMSEGLLEDYKVVFKDFKKLVPKPDLYIYLKCPPTILLERIQRRNRPGEKVDLSYLITVEELYDNWLKDEKRCYRVNTEHDVMDVAITIENIIYHEVYNCKGGRHNVYSI